MELKENDIKNYGHLLFLIININFSTGNFEGLQIGAIELSIVYLEY